MTLLDERGRALANRLLRSPDVRPEPMKTFGARTPMISDGR